MRFLEATKHFLNRHQLILHTVGLIAAVGVQLAQALQLPLPPATANAITFSFLAYILKDISDNTYIFTRNKSYSKQDEMYADLIQQIQGIERIKEAILIQYSSRKANPLIYALMDKGAKVTLYIKNPDNDVISQMQKERINRAIAELSTDVWGTSGTLEVYKYDPPGSVRGVMIDNRVLAIGWYAYEYVSKSERNQNYSNDMFAVWSHNVAGMLLYKGSIEFEIFKELFLKQVENYKANVSELNRKPCLQIKEGKVNHTT